MGRAIKQTQVCGIFGLEVTYLEEGTSLLENRKMNGNLLIDPKFLAKQRWIWTSDIVSRYRARIVWLIYASVHWGYGDDSSHYVYVRPVRSGQK